MPHWNTKQVIADLKKIPGITKIKNSGQGGDYDSDNLMLSVQGSVEHLFVCAFSVERQAQCDPSNDLFEMVEVSDGTNSSGGLQCDCEELGFAYVRVRKYFFTKGFEVVTCLRDYF